MKAAGHLQGRITGVLLTLANLLILAYVVYLLVDNLASQRTLKAAAELRFMREAETQAGTIGYYLSERQRDIARLASIVEVHTYFQNRALGMSMEYGLRTSLAQIARMFGEVLAERTVTGVPLFSTLKLVETDGTLLVENDGVAGEGIKGPLSGVEAKPRLFAVTKQGERFIQVSAPIFFKLRLVGYVLAEVSPSTLLQGVDTAADASSHAWMGLYSGETLLQSLSHLDGAGAPVSAAQSPAGTVCYCGEWLSYLCEAPGTPFSLQMAMRARLLVGTQNPWRSIVGVGAVSVAALFIFIGVVRHAQSRKAAEVLRYERERLASIIEGTHVGTWEWNVPTGETVFNERWAAIMGYTLKELEPVSIETWMRLAHPDDLQRSDELLKQHFDGALDYYEFESRMKHKDGRWVWVLDRGKVVRWTADGKPLLMSGTHQDITRRKRMEEQLHSRTAILSNLLDSIPDIVFFKDRQGVYLGCNPRFAEFVGRERERIVGFTDQDLFSKEVADFFGENDNLMMAEKKPRHNEEWVSYPDGRRVLLDTLKSPLCDAGGEVIGLLGISRDITSRKRAEDDLRHHAEIETLMATTSMQFINLKPEETEFRIQETLTEVGWLIGVDRVYVFAYAPDLLSCSNTYEWCAQGIAPQIANLQNVPSELLPWWTAQMRALRNIVIPDVSRLPSEAGGERELLQSQGIQSLLVVPLSWGGRVEGFMGFDSVRRNKEWTDDDVAPLELLAGIVHNALKHKEGELQLRELNATLERRVEERTRELQAAQATLFLQDKMASVGQLAAGLAHEINNPVSFVSTNFATLEENMGAFREMFEAYRDLALAEVPADPARREQQAKLQKREEELALEFLLRDMPNLFAESRDGFRRITALINSMRTFARKDGADEFAPYNLNKGIENTLVIARNAYKYNAELDLRLGEIPDVPAVAGQINQVLLNILVNAAQSLAAHPRQEKKGVITVRTWSEPEAVICEIADNGPGIPPGVERKIFDPFFTTKAPGEGTGLGLSISYDIVVNKHNGRLTVCNEPGGGACFRIALPRRLPAADAPPEGVSA